MIHAPLVMIDPSRLLAFRLLGQPRKMFRGFTTQADAHTTWASAVAEPFVFAVSSLGAGWVYDPFFRSHRHADFEQEQQEVRDEALARQRLEQFVREVRLGAIAKRLLLALHAETLRRHVSLYTMADVDLGVLVWGSERRHWPKNWRAEILTILRGLSRLHVAEQGGANPIEFGMRTALITRVADLRGTPDDVCDETCGLHGLANHHHFLINIGRGFLGVLEQFAHDDTSTGIRTYEFTLGKYGERGPTLRSVGREGRIRSVYLPAHLSPPDAPKLTHSRVRLLDAILREMTRSQTKERKSVGTAAVFRGNRVPSADGRRDNLFPLLQSTGTYSEFNGNRVRRRLGYYLTTPGGWLAKAGYPLDAVEQFLDDLAIVSQLLGLYCSAIHRSRDEWQTLEALRAMQQLPAGRSRSKEFLLRIYTDHDFLERWNTIFRWSSEFNASEPASDAEIISIVASLKELNIMQRQLAVGLRFDPAFLSRILRGLSRPPAGLTQRARDWIAQYSSQVE